MATSGSGSTGSGTSASTGRSLSAVTGHTVVEVTLPRRNTDAGLAPYSIKSETYDPRSSNY
jgi:hypothetical protein